MRQLGAPLSHYALALLVLLLIWVQAAAGPAAAADSGGSGYGVWRLGGQAGSLSVPVAGFPAAAFTTTSQNSTVASGSSIYLNQATPFGAVFGSSRSSGYLLLRTAAAKAPSITTITFAAPAPAGSWGFALGDVDSDHVRVDGVGADGSALSSRQLGWQGGFNSCATSPRPSSCTRPPFTDVPRWDPATRTLIGNVADTTGASGWFRPSADVASLTLTFSVQSGIPAGQLWVAAVSRTISGSVSRVDGVPPPNTTLTLRHADGSPVLTKDGRPLTNVTDDRGAYRFNSVLPGTYRVSMVPPRNFRAVGATELPAKTVRGSVTGVDFKLRLVRQPATPEEVPDLRVADGTAVARVPQIDHKPPVQLEILRPPHHGTVEVTEDGAIAYRPQEHYSGQDSFVYRATNRDGTAVESTVRVTVPAAPTSSPRPAHSAPTKPDRADRGPVRPGVTGQLAATGSNSMLLLGSTAFGLITFGSGTVLAAGRISRRRRR
jgi:hypothetical protein